MMGKPMGDIASNTYQVEGEEDDDYWILLPKFALKYTFDPKNNLYATVSRGYRSGGYVCSLSRCANPRSAAARYAAEEESPPTPQVEMRARAAIAIPPPSRYAVW